MPVAPSDEALLARILAEEATGQIADSLGLPPEEYAARVLHYMKNPTADPIVTVMTPEQEKAAGVPSMAESLEFLDKLASGEIPLGNEHEQSRFAGFDDDEKSAATSTGGPQKTTAPKVPAASPTTAPVVAKRGLSKK